MGGPACGIETGAAAQVTSAPKHPYARRLMLASPVADPVAQAQRREQRLRAACARGVGRGV